MARISVDPTEDKNKPKFFAFRKKFNWPPYQAFGFLCAFWVSILESEEHETGDISACTPDFIADRVGIGNVDPNELWEALLQGYIEARPNGRFIVQDWIEIAGPHLRQKYHNRENGRQRLCDIWSLHGRIYGRETKTQKSPESKEEDDSQSDDSHLTVSSIEAKNPVISSFTSTLPPQRHVSKDNDNSKDNGKDKDNYGEPSLETLTTVSKEGTNEKNSSVKALVDSSIGETGKQEALSDVSFLLMEYHEKLSEKIAPEKPVSFSWPIAGTVFKQMLKAGLNVNEIALRFRPWFASTLKFVVDRSYDARDFKTFYTKLKDGPISNQVHPNATRKPAYQGADAFTDERARQVQREIDEYERTRQSIPERLGSE